MVADAESPPIGPLVLRPFPPPALENVPLPYILDQLTQLAVHYWDKPETADCTIVVPIVQSKAKATRNSEPFTNDIVATQPVLPLTPPDTPSNVSPMFPKESESAPRRVSEANMMQVSRMTSKLHLDYLISQSSLFRSMFNGRNPLEHLTGARLDSPESSHPMYGPSRPSRVTPPAQMPRVLPSSSPSHPVILLPIPHPPSFPHLVHFMYFGSTTLLEDALNTQQFRWDDVVRNVEYLGMRTRMKVFLGRWYADRIAPARGASMGNSSGSGSRLPGWSSAVSEERESGDEEESYDGSCSEFGSEYSAASGSRSHSRSGSISGSEFGDGDLMVDEDSDAEMDLDDMDPESRRRMEMASLKRAIADDKDSNRHSDIDVDIASSRHFASTSNHSNVKDIPQSSRTLHRRGRRRERQLQQGGEGEAEGSESSSEAEPERGRMRVRSRPKVKNLGKGVSTGKVAVGLEVEV